MDESFAKKKKLSLSTNENAMAEKPSKISKETAEERIQHFLILKAWRHQKERNKRLEADIKFLSNQVDSLQLQVFTLKSLLEAEKNRVVNVNNDFRKLLTSLEETNHEKQTLIKEREQYEVRLRLMEEKLGAMEMEYKNQKNELLTARSEAQSWEKQLEKEREKLTKMKDERKCFMEEVRFKGNLLMWQIRSFEQFSRFFNILQTKPNNPALTWNESLARNDPDPEPVQCKIQKKLPTAVAAERPLRSPELRISRRKAEKKTPEEGERIGELQKSILEKTAGLLPSEYFKVVLCKTQEIERILQ